MKNWEPLVLGPAFWGCQGHVSYCMTWESSEDSVGTYGHRKETWLVVLQSEVLVLEGLEAPDTG